MTTRPLDVADASDCVRLAGDGLGLSAAQYVEEVGRSDRHWLAVDRGATLIGFGGTWDAPDVCHLLAIAVAPEHRRAGVGGLLLDQLLGDARARGANAMTLEVRGDNDAALALYRSRGFRTVGRRPSYYGEADALLLTVELVAVEAGSA